MTRILPALAALVLLKLAAHAAPTAPSGPLRLVVPFSPGGGSDTFARIVQKVVRDADLSPVPVVIVNVPGAGGTIGSRQVMEAKADGQTALLLHDGIFTAKYSGKVNYGPEAFEPVAAMGSFRMVLAVKEDSRFKDLPAMLEEVATNPDSVTYSTNLGAPSHFAGLMLEKTRPSAAFRFVQGGGGAKRLSALLGGHAEVSVFSVAEYGQFKDSGLRALAVLGKSRHDAFPNVPSAYELGVEVSASSTQFIWVPKGTAAERVQWLAELFQKVSMNAFYQERMAALHTEQDFWSGDALHQEVLARGSAYAAVDLRKLEHSANLERWVLACVLLLGAILLIRRRETSGDAAAARLPSLRRGLLGLGMVVLYVLLMEVKVDYRVSTGLFIFLFGMLFVERTSRNLASLAVFATILALAMHWVFTGPLFVDLP